jgi:ABC-type multidrug transport system ATPase subunit
MEDSNRMMAPSTVVSDDNSSDDGGQTELEFTISEDGTSVIKDGSDAGDVETTPVEQTTSTTFLKGTLADPQAITTSDEPIEIDKKKSKSDEIELTSRTTISSTTTTTTTVAPATQAKICDITDVPTADEPTKRRKSTLLYQQRRQNQTLAFRNITLTTKSTIRKMWSNKGSTSFSPRKILDDVTANIPPRQITALMGPSGSGKTSLINVLTGRIQTSKLDLSGQVLMDNNAVSPSDIQVRREIAYVEQGVSIPSTCTPREAIQFSARLRLDKSLTADDIDMLVDEQLTQLGLQKCADTMIGGGLLMGGGKLSGGEKKRTQCGVELVTNPGIIVLDEPTTGLDSYSSVMFVDTLKQLAQAGACVVLTIHQPPPTIVRELDHLILLRSGRLLYNGRMGDPLLSYLKQKGVPKPSDFNIADWILVSAISCEVEPYR